MVHLMFSRWSIRSQLLAVVLVTMAPLLLAAVLSIRDQKAEARKTALDNAQGLARQISARLDEHILNIDSLLVAAGAAVSGDLGALAANDAKLRAIHASLPDYFGSISVLAADGRMLSSATASPAE